MADNHFEPGDEERVWDEYDWEHFLQQQDRKTEKYMELLEKFLDDPNRDQIIAREMGWHHLLDDENGKDWTRDLESLFNERHERNSRPPAESGEEDAEDETEDETEPAEDETEDEFREEEAQVEEEALDARQRQNPLYQAASSLPIFLDQLFDERDAHDQQHPAVARLTTNATLASVKLAAALSDDDVDELGMTIAYLKRALKAITSALEAAAHCHQEHLLSDIQAEEVRQRIFHVRDGIVSLIGDFRTEWRRRYGGK